MFCTSAAKWSSSLEKRRKKTWPRGVCVPGGGGSPCVEANNPGSAHQVHRELWLTGLDMRPSPHLTFGFHKVWNKRQGQNNQRGAQANKSVYSSSPAPSLPCLCTSSASPHHAATLGGGRRRAQYYLFTALVDPRTPTAGHFRPPCLPEILVCMCGRRGMCIWMEELVRTWPQSCVCMKQRQRKHSREGWRQSGTEDWGSVVLWITFVRICGH